MARRITAQSRCGADSCQQSVSTDAPVQLCEHHLAVAADWAGRQFGVEDVLPTPCRLCGSRLGVRYPSGWLCGVCEWRHSDLIDDELPLPRVDVVYYIRFDDRVKIGTSSNPRRRLSAIWHHDLLAFERGDRSLEHRRHEEFAEERFDRTEWFAFSERLRGHVDIVRAGGENPWDRYLRWVSEAVALRG
jgi:hypothetical protein